MSNEADTPCYTALCKCGCGGMIFAAVDEPGQSKQRQRDTAKEVAKLIRDGFTIDRMPVGEVRKHKWTCQRDVVGKSEGNTNAR